MLDQIRTGEIKTLSSEILGLDQLLIGANGALGRRRPRHPPPAGLIGDDRTGEPPACHDDTAGEPVRDPSCRLTCRLSLGRGPDHTELGPWHPDVPYGYPCQFGRGDVHRLRMTGCTDGMHSSVGANPTDNHDAHEQEFGASTARG